MRQNSWFTVAAVLTFILVLPHPRLVWRQGQTEALRFLKNDPAFAFFVPLVFPLAIGIIAKIVVAEYLPVLYDLRYWVLAVFLGLGTSAAVVFEETLFIPFLLTVFVVLFLMLVTISLAAAAKVGQ